LAALRLAGFTVLRFAVVFFFLLAMGLRSALARSILVGQELIDAPV
jgi:hypothetical protein